MRMTGDDMLKRWGLRWQGGRCIKRVGRDNPGEQVSARRYYLLNVHDHHDILAVLARGSDKKKEKERNAPSAPCVKCVSTCVCFVPGHPLLWDELTMCKDTGRRRLTDDEAGIILQMWNCLMRMHYHRHKCYPSVFFSFPQARLRCCCCPTTQLVLNRLRSEIENE